MQSWAAGDVCEAEVFRCAAVCPVPGVSCNVPASPPEGSEHFPWEYSLTQGVRAFPLGIPSPFPQEHAHGHCWAC